MLEFMLDSSVGELMVNGGSLVVNFWMVDVDVDVLLSALQGLLAINRRIHDILMFTAAI